jgi:hypothetical protein
MTIAAEVLRLHEAYGERLMHRQQPGIDLLAAIDQHLGAEHGPR